MKRRYIFSAVLMGMLFFTSCEDFLENDHPTAVTDELWWNTEQDARAALWAVYAGIPHGTTGRQVQFWSALSDELVARQSSRGEYQAFTQGLATPSWGVAEHIWRDDYRAIRRANRFLENVGRASMGEELKNRFKYEARALRAYYHMELLMLFGDVPLVTTAVTPNEAALPRTDQDEVYNFIISELTESANNLPAEYNDADRSRISAGIAWALISRLALFQHDYETARDAAQKVIELGVYELHDDYEALFKYEGELNNERIFFKENGSVYAWETLAPQGVGGRTVLSPTAAIVNAYETKQGRTIQELSADSLEIYQANPNYNNNRDPRLTASVLLPGQTFSNNELEPFNTSTNNRDRIGAEFSTATGYWMYKYVDALDRNGARNLDYTIIRYAEVLLNYVEALVELGQWDHPDVNQFLNEVRNRAEMPDVDRTVYNSQEKMRELVRRERQVELAFETVRYFDLRRWGIYKEEVEGPVYGAVNPATGDQVLVETREISGFNWPIPQNEILSNPNIDQNPEY